MVIQTEGAPETLAEARAAGFTPTRWGRRIRATSVEWGPTRSSLDHTRGNRDGFRVSQLAAFEAMLPRIAEACQAVYGDRLVSLVVFGSVARGTPNVDSDIDLLIVVRELPWGRTRRMREFQGVKALVAPELSHAAAQGVHTRLSPILKTRDEVRAGSALFLDMTEDAKVLLDRDGFMQAYLRGLRGRLTRLGAKRVWRGDSWYWDLKPDYKPGQVFEI